MHDQPELSKLIGMAIVRCDRCRALFDIGDTAHAVGLEYLCEQCWQKHDSAENRAYRYPERIKPSKAGLNRRLDDMCKNIKVKAK